MKELNINNKNGVFLCKDQKINSLESNNQRLRIELAKQIELFNQLNQQKQSVQSKYSSLTTRTNFLEIEQAMLIQTNSKLQAKIQQLQPSINHYNQLITSLTEEVNLLQDQLEKKLLDVKQNSNLVQRYKQEVRAEKMMLKSEKNLNKISETFKKSHQNYQKNVHILQNKLQSKKKYLQILTKKIEKQKEADKEQQKVKPSSLKYSRNQKTKLTQKKFSNNIAIKAEQQKQIKDQRKSYNDLIRKKNAILYQKK